MSKSLIVVYSYHHGNTEKLARAMAEKMSADVKHPQDISPEPVQEFDIVGFGTELICRNKRSALKVFAITKSL